MAGAKSSISAEYDAEAQQRQKDTRRDELGRAFAIILSPPYHGQDRVGKWSYGISPLGGMPNSTMVVDFEVDMRSVIMTEAEALLTNGLLSKQDIAAVEGVPYDIPPAAQSWPMFLYSLYQDARPFLNDGASLLAWGMFFRGVLRGAREWAERQRSQLDYEQNHVPPGRWAELSLRPICSQSGIIALCYADLVSRYGVGDDVAIEAHSRSHFFTSPDRPGGKETYLVRCSDGRKSYFYSVTSHGKVTEHFLLAGKSLTLLPLAIWDEDDQSGEYQHPQPVQRVRIKA